LCENEYEKNSLIVKYCGYALKHSFDHISLFSLDQDVEQVNFTPFFNNILLSDATLIVEDKEIHCHRIILANQSNYFRSMFLSPMIESKQKRITINCQKYNTMLILIKYLYSGDITLIQSLPMEELVSILHTSNEFQVKGLEQLTTNYIILNFLKKDNVFEFMEISQTLHNKKLLFECCSIILKNWEEFISSPETRSIIFSDSFKYSLEYLFTMT